MHIIIAVVLITTGAAIIIYSVYSRFFRSYSPDPKRWIRVRVKSGSVNNYTERTISKYGSGVKYGTEYPITYTVEGKTYSAYTDEKCSHVFCERNNPKYFKQPSYFHNLKHQGKSSIIFTVFLLFGVIIVLFGCGILS